MKINKLILGALLSLLSMSLTGQTPYLKIDPANFLGKWTATENGMTYDLEFVRQWVYVDSLDGEEGDNRDKVLGKITYRKGDTVLRKTEFDGFASIMFNFNILSSYRAVFIFRDELRNVRAYIEFTINEADPKKATWKFLRYEGRGWNTENKIDIPDGITFHKVVE